MNGRKAFFVIGLLLLAGLLSTAPAPAGPAKLDVVTYRDTLQSGGGDSPWFLGLDKGFFTEQGIDLRLPEGTGSAINAQLVGAGTLKISACDYGTMMISISKGLPIKAIFGYNQSTPMSIISPADAPIRHPKELEGKKLGTSAGSSLNPLFSAVCKRSGADESKITKVMVAPAVVIPLLLDRKVDAIILYWPKTVAEMKAKGMKVHAASFGDFGVNVVSEGAIANAAFIRENPDLVRRFVRAAQKSWAYAMERPEEATVAFGKQYPYYDRRVYLEELQAYLTLIRTPATQGKPLGWMAKEDWERSQNILHEAGVLEKKTPVENYYTNEFIPK